MGFIILIICIAGAVGGLVNALLSDNGFLMPKWDDESKQRIWQPGMIGNIIIGAVAAFISWGLYGPLASYVVLSTKSTPESESPSLTLSALVGAVLIGVGGARWLTNEVDKSLLQKAATKLAAYTLDKDKAVEIATAKPAEAVALAYSL